MSDILIDVQGFSCVLYIWAMAGYVDIGNKIPA